MSSGELTVDILQSGQPSMYGLVLNYGQEPGKTVNLVTLVRRALTDPKANIQVYIADEPCGTEINWANLTIQSAQEMSKVTLDILSTKYVAINVTYAFGTPYRITGDVCL